MREPYHYLAVYVAVYLTITSPLYITVAYRYLGEEALDRCELVAAHQAPGEQVVLRAISNT